MAEFDPDGYRKRVLAAVLKRGGPETSDPFELYDLPVDGDLDDVTVAARVAEVWGCWQRQRDHPKYRVLVAELVGGHAERSAELLDAGRRRTAAARVRAQREQRDGARFALLDAAISRLVERHRGIPADKVDGLHEVGALAGLTRDEVTARLRRHRTVRGGAQPGITPDRRRQVRALLDEFGRLTEAPAPPTLLALLGLESAATDQQVRAGAAAWRSRARELPPQRLRTVVDELLVHVAELVEPGRAAIETYLDAVAADVTEHLRPRVRAAVLVEDRLVAEDHDHLLDEARALGLDDTRARAVLAAVAAELGAPIEGPGAPPPPAPAPSRDWEGPLKAARAALRAGRAAEAQRLVREAQRVAGPDGATPVRAVADEIAGVLDDAARRWTAVGAAGRRSAEALEHLEQLARTASDVPDPRGGSLDDLLARARAEVARADDAVASAPDGPGRAVALLAVLDACPGHPGATAALAAIPVESPRGVRVTRDARGDVLVAWDADPAADLRFKVSRRRPDGNWHVVGRVTGTSVVDGGAPAGPGLPVYAVEAVQAGRSSAPVRSDEPAPAQSPPPAARPSPAQPGARPSPAEIPPAQRPPAESASGRSVPAWTGPASSGRAGSAPVGPGSDRPARGGPTAGPAAGSAGPADGPGAVRAERAADGAVVVSWSWTGPPGAEFRVRCRMPDGRWRVVGRTRGHRIEDGGAPNGPVPGYTVSAAVDGVRSAEVATR